MPICFLLHYAYKEAIISKRHLVAQLILQVGHEAIDISVDGWTYREGFGMTTVVLECLDGVLERNGIP
jgi:hypothetical protein